MTQQLAPERPVQAAAGQAAANPTGLVAAAAAVRGAAVAAAGLILATGLATIVWAMTPASGQDVAVAMRAGVIGFAAANLMPIGVGGVTLSLPPLLFTLLIVVLLASTARRGRFLPEGRYQETVSVLITALVYGVIVAATTRGFGPGAVAPQWVWTAPAIALLASGGAMLQPGSAWHEWCLATMPGWLRVSIRGGGVGLGMLLAGGGLAVTVGLISHFGDVVSVAALAAPSWMDGLGLAMLGLAYLPNAVIAGAGYVTGVGFEVGAGTYSPFSTVPVDLPAVPLLAAVPDAAGRSWLGLIFLAVPIAAGYLIARVAIRRLATRADRTLAAGVGALLTGGLLAAVVAVARGGIGAGRWSTMGSPPLLIAAAVSVEVGVIAAAVAGLTGARTVPWRAAVQPPAARLPVSSAEDPSPAVQAPAHKKRRGSQRSADSEPGRDHSPKKGRRSTRRGRSAGTGPGDPDPAASDGVPSTETALQEGARDEESSTASPGSSVVSEVELDDDRSAAGAVGDMTDAATDGQGAAESSDQPDFEGRSQLEGSDDSAEADPAPTGLDDKSVAPDASTAGGSADHTPASQDPTDQPS